MGHARQVHGGADREWEEIFSAIDCSDGSARQGVDRRLGGTIQIVKRTLRRVAHTLFDIRERRNDPQAITRSTTACS